MKAVLALLALAGAGVVAWNPSNQGEREVVKFATSLDGRTPGQSRNARLAARAIDGKVIPARREFSFNKTLGGWTRDKGYVLAPVSYNGQLLPSWGGGVCQTSTTLYNAALEAGLEIRERHRHEFGPTYVAPGRDAAVAYEDIDLRIANPFDFPLTIRAKIEGDRLVVGLVASQPLPRRAAVRSVVLSMSAPGEWKVGQGDRARVRNSGKPGLEVQVWRDWGNRRELVSHDTYPVMHRIVERAN
ncbi:MAG: VanW family protein [Chthonomonas sp.]|nr:VanW family protein [Chthonomonas sp.]